MKKDTKKIALFLVLVAVVNIFSGCLSWWLMTGKELDISGFSGKDGLGIIFLPILDVILLVPALIVFAIRMAIEAERAERGDMLDAIDTFSAVRSLTEKDLFFLKEKFCFMPEEKFSYLMQRFDSLSDTQIGDFLKTAGSLSEMQLSSIINGFYNFSEDEIAFSIEILNSMPEENFITTLNNLQYLELRSAK